MTKNIKLGVNDLTNEQVKLKAEGERLGYNVELREDGNLYFYNEKVDLDEESFKEEVKD